MQSFTVSLDPEQRAWLLEHVQRTIAWYRHHDDHPPVWLYDLEKKLKA